MTDSQLIFLVSQPRSGSTMLQAILGGHPDIHTCSEPWIALPFLYPLKMGGAEFDFDNRLGKSAIDAFFAEAGIGDEYYLSALNSFLTSLYGKALTSSGKRLFLDKTPRYYEILPELKKVFPQAKFIVLLRHPLSVLNSILKTWVNDEVDKLYYYPRDLLAAPRKMTDFISAHGDDLCLVHYEELVQSPQSEVKRICNHIDVDYNDSILNYNKNVDWFYGDKNFKNNTSPNIDSVDLWVKQLENKRHANFSHYYLRSLGEETVTALGYDYRSSLACVEGYSPDGSDFELWEKLLPESFVTPVEEQRMRIKGELNSSGWKKFCRKLLS